MDMNSAKTRFASVYESHVDSLFRFCLWKSGDREMTKDLVQESFMRFWDELSTGKNIENDRALLFTIARRLVIDHYRKKKSLSLDSMIDGEEFEHEPVDRSTLDGEAGAAGRYALDSIKKLEPAAQQAIYLRFVEELNPKEIAQILEISPNAASVRIDRGLKKLKEILDPKTHE